MTTLLNILWNLCAVVGLCFLTLCAVAGLSCVAIARHEIEMEQLGHRDES